MTALVLDRRTFLSAGSAALGILAASRSNAASPDLLSKEAVLFDPDAPVFGNAKGDVTIVEFFDYQCPYCKKSHPDVARLVADDGKVRHVLKDWPIFGAPSVYASRLVLAAGKDMRRAQAALFATKGKLTPGDIDDTLRSAGLSLDRLKTAYVARKDRVDGLLQRNGAQAEGFGFIGTPAYVIGTVLYPGVVDPAEMRRAVAAARKG